MDGGGDEAQVLVEQECCFSSFDCSEITSWLCFMYRLTYDVSVVLSRGLNSNIHLTELSGITKYNRDHDIFHFLSPVLLQLNIVLVFGK